MPTKFSCLFILYLFFSGSLLAEKEKPCLEAVTKFCNGVKTSELEECLDKNRKSLNPKCIELLDVRIAEKVKIKKDAKDLADKKQKAIEAPIGKCLKGSLICPPVVDRYGQTKKANTVPCPCHADDCLSSGPNMCIDPKDEEKFAEDLSVSDGIAWSNFNQCLYDQEQAKGDPKKCDSIHPFTYRGLNIPKSDEQCEKDFQLPANSYGSDKVRYRIELNSLCSSAMAKSSEVRKCILKEIPKLRAIQPIDNLREASTQCDPIFKACKKMAGVLASSTSKTGETLDQNCRLNPALSNAEIKCLARESSKGKEFQEYNGLSRYICLNEYRPCIEKLQKNVKGQASTAELKVIATACKESKPEAQDCFYKNFSAHAFAKGKPTFGKESEDVSQFCAIQNPVAAECVKNNYKLGLAFKEALMVCKYATEEMRQCMSEFTLKKGEVANMNFSDPSVKVSFANEYCSYSDKKDQSCFITNYKELIADNEHEKALTITRTRCHNFTQACYQNYNKLFSITLQSQLALEKFSIEKICEGNNGAVETCIFKKILVRFGEDQKRNQLARKMFGTTDYPVDTFRKECVKTFTEFLLSEMPGLSELKFECDESMSPLKMKTSELWEFCDLGLYVAECDKQKLGAAWRLSAQELRDQCTEIQKHKSHTTMEENILRRCKLEK